MGRVTQFISFINLDRKKLKLGQNLSSKDSDFYYTHITMTKKIKRARYEHQLMLKKEKR